VTPNVPQKTALPSNSWQRAPGPHHRILGGVCHALHTGTRLPFGLVRFLLVTSLSLGVFPTALIYVALWAALPVGQAAEPVLETQLVSPTEPKA
jgi:phage shock protein PspC (stress-responsive transcriptional regulator)